MSASTRSAPPCASTTLPTVQGDPALLHQVLQNLIDNAAKYRDPDRPAEIVVSAEPEERDDDDGTPWWRISVRDNGVGIAAGAPSARCSTCSPGPSRVLS